MLPSGRGGGTLYEMVGGGGGGGGLQPHPYPPMVYCTPPQ